MSNVDSAERPDSHELVADLLSEARNLISRERTVEENNLLQIQHVIEAAQRELRRLRIRSEVDRFFAVGEAADPAVDGVDTDDSGEGIENRNDLDDAGNGSPDDGSGGVISAMARQGKFPSLVLNSPESLVLRQEPKLFRRMLRSLKLTYILDTLLLGHYQDLRGCCSKYPGMRTLGDQQSPRSRSGKFRRKVGKRRRRRSKLKMPV
jgi:hypothetical protein